jgi:UDP-N-acetylglucosamine transferase subunit ALG13
VIFASVGTQLPFARLISALDALAPEIGEPICAQIGEDPARYENIDAYAKMEPARYDAAFAEARLVVAHAGIGSILTARRLEKPLILMPRKHSLGEHRNDHQAATAAHVRTLPGIYIADDAEALRALITQDLAPANNQPGPHIDALIGTIRDFIRR